MDRSEKATGPGWSVRAVSGPMKGQVLKVLPGLPVVVGRASNVDLILAGDEQVSRRHAKLTTIGDRLFLEDLKSTNKTFVNDQEISVVQLSHDDRIRIGNTTLEVIGPASVLKPKESQAAAEDRKVSSKEERQRSIMEGSLAEVALPDLLQLFSAGEMSITVHMRQDGVRGRVYVRKGTVQSAELEASDLPPLECLYMLLGWSRGEFAVVLDTSPFRSGVIDLPFHEIMMEFMGRLDQPTDMTIDIDVAELPGEVDPGLRRTMVGGDFSFDEQDLTAADLLSPQMEAPASASPSFSGEDLALSKLPWRTEMSGDTLDRETIAEIASALNNHSEHDWAVLREVSRTTLAWIDEITMSFDEIRRSPERCAAVFGPTASVPDGAEEACRAVVQAWLRCILGGAGDEALFRESWIAGLMHLSEGVRTVYFLSWMARLQECFEKKCVEAFAPTQAFAVASAFARITCTAVALAVEARETGSRLSVLNFGVNAGLLHKMEVQMAWRLIAAARKSLEE